MAKDEQSKEEKAAHDPVLTQHKAAEAQPKPTVTEFPTGKMTEEAKLRAESDSKLEAERAAEADKKTKHTEGLVKMVKQDEVIHVHPSTVIAHHSAGWKAE